VDNFLGKWAEIHHNMSLQRGEIKRPIFYHPPMKSSESLPLVNRSQSENGVQSLVFKIITEDANANSRDLTMLCVEEAERKLDTDLGSEFCVVVKESSGVTKVESFSRGEEMEVKLKYEIRESRWEEFGVQEVAFNEGNKPVHVCSWIDYVRNGYVMTVTLSNLKNNACAVIVVSTPLSSSSSSLSF